MKVNLLGRNDCTHSVVAQSEVGHSKIWTPPNACACHVHGRLYQQPVRISSFQHLCRYPFAKATMIRFLLSVIGMFTMWMCQWLLSQIGMKNCMRNEAILVSRLLVKSHFFFMKINFLIGFNCEMCVLPAHMSKYRVPPSEHHETYDL